MTASDRFDVDVRAFLESEAPARAPAGLHDAVMARAPGIRQRPGWVVAFQRGGLAPSWVLGGPRPAWVGLVALLGLILAAVVGSVLVAALLAKPPLGRTG